MKRFAAFLWVCLLAACAGTGLPEPGSVPDIRAAEGRWFRLEERDAAGNTLRDSLLALEQGGGGIRFVQTDALGAPLARQVLDKQGWHNDGFVMPNAASRRLFGAILPLFAADAAAVYPGLERKNVQGKTCYGKNGRDLWCTEQAGGGWLIVFPGQTRWLLTPVREQ